MSGKPSIHHVAYACRDAVETHRFYADLLGLDLVHTEVQKRGEAWIRHTFYDTGDGSCIAFFQLNQVGEPTPLKTAISTDLGLPVWVNHFAFRADAARVAEVRGRMAAAGIEPVMDLDHGWCQSVYYGDPNGILVELCEDRPGIPTDRAEAARLLTALQ